ncbi:MAG: bifunctional 5,10-methylenetetrahydrofolate dehydrogenase/5,10-methenyltetrahydrofolate cyclohydrolase [Spirochaetota bacterium]
MSQIPCKEIVEKVIDGLKSCPIPKKILAAVLVGENSASISFLKQKEKIAKELGVDFRIYNFNDSPEEKLTNDELRQKINRITNQKLVGGVIIQLPLPEQFNSQEILNAIPAKKDIDVLSEQALKDFNAGKGKILPPAVGVVEEILKTLNLKLGTLKVAVIGTGQLVGKPIAAWLKEKTAELIILNSKTENIKEELKNADIIISGAGKPNLFSAEDLKKNAIVIDFGYSLINGKISGDFNPNSPIIQSSNSLKYTPTPGGTGPILVAKIMENFYKLANNK